MGKILDFMMSESWNEYRKNRLMHEAEEKLKETDIKELIKEIIPKR